MEPRILEIKAVGIPEEELKMPRRQHTADVGADVFVPKDTICKAKSVTRIPLCFSVAVPEGYGAFVFPRSGKSSKGLETLLPPIDPGYTDSITAIVANLTDEDKEVKKGEAIGQLVILPVVLAEYRLTDKNGRTLHNTIEDEKIPSVERRTGGFGSTGN